MSQANANSQAVISVSAGRFPWVQAFKDRYGIDRGEWRALTDAVFPNAKSLDTIVLALSYCKARNLDVFKRPVHIVPMYSTASNSYVDTIWPGIGELRTTAVRTGAFAGRDAAVYGPTVKATYGDEEVEHPEWCEVVVYRMVEGQRVACHGPRVYWRETFATDKDKVSPNKMWCKRPFGQLEKCAEAAALRAAFPEEIGNEYTAEEMEGKIIEGRFEQVPDQSAPAATRQPSRNKLAAFAESEPPTDDELAVLRARVTAICETVALARTESALTKIEVKERAFLSELDAKWPDGKTAITQAIAAQKESLSEASPGSAGERAATAADGESRAGAAARNTSTEREA